ncbi:MAG: hypothetical protein HZA15_14710 [Nitrospirae bacterium]|nr:hypothetical protein [Nitrospirota bacterium]
MIQDQRKNPSTSKRKSIAFFQPGSIRPDNDLISSSHVHMFAEDVHLHVMPLGSHARTKHKFTVELTSPDVEVEKIIRYAFPHNGYVQHSLTESISEFIKQCAFELAYKGLTFHEIVRGRQIEDRRTPSRKLREEPPDPERMFFASHIPGQVINIGSHYVQIIPRVEWAKWRRAFILIPSSDVWRIEIPKQLGGYKNHPQLLRALIKSGTPLPKFINDAMAEQKELPTFDFKEFHKQQDLIAANETAVWGWAGRELWRDQTLEYYQFYRHVCFAKTMNVLREHILLSINSLLKRISFSSNLVIKGLPSLAELDETLSKMAKGEISFDDAWNAIDL